MIREVISLKLRPTEMPIKQSVKAPRLDIINSEISQGIAFQDRRGSRFNWLTASELMKGFQK